jgi:hypothetical protein
VNTCESCGTVYGSDKMSCPECADPATHPISALKLYFRWAGIGLFSGPIIVMHYYSDGAPGIFLLVVLAAGPALGLCYAGLCIY